MEFDWAGGEDSQVHPLMGTEYALYLQNQGQRVLLKARSPDGDEVNLLSVSKDDGIVICDANGIDSVAYGAIDDGENQWSGIRVAFDCKGRISTDSWI